MSRSDYPTNALADVVRSGLINAAPYIASAFCGCWLSDPLNNYFGRRGTIFFAAVFCLLSVIGSGLTQNWYQLFICRLLLGIGMGAKASTVPIYAVRESLTFPSIIADFSRPKMCQP